MYSLTISVLSGVATGKTVFLISRASDTYTEYYGNSDHRVSPSKSNKASFSMRKGCKLLSLIFLVSTLSARRPKVSVKTKL